MSLLRQTRVEILKPDSESPRPMQRVNTEDPAHVCYATGSLTHLSMLRASQVAGVDARLSWQWLGHLPVGVHPDSGGNWELRADTEGKDRRFLIHSAVHTTHWQLQLTEVT